MTRQNSPEITEIDADTWAESGGTAGMYGAAFKAGRLKIVSDPDGKLYDRLHDIDE